jgi:hypothetical protein
LATGSGTVNLAFDADTTLYAQYNPFQRILLANIDTAKAVAFADHNTFTGDDGRGIAITPEFIFYTGDDHSVRYDHNLKNGKRLPRLDGLFSDLETGQLYLFRNNDAFSTTNFDRIQPIDTAGIPIGSPILLSQPLQNFGSSNSIVFNGFGYVIFYDGNGDDFYRISLPSGQVTLIKENYDLSDQEDAESYWAWYMSEVNGNEVSLIYHKRNTNDLVRLNLTTEQKTKVATFQNLGGDAAQFVFSPWTGRLFYHNENNNAYASGNEMLTAFQAGVPIQCAEAPRTAVSITITPCAQPINPSIRAGSVTYTSAILDWTPVSTCNANVPTDVYFSSSNTAPAVGTIPTFDNVAVDSTRFFYLECGTTYYAWLRTDCGSIESTWVGPFQFTTQSVDQVLGILPSSSVTSCAGVSTTFTATVLDGADLTWYDAPVSGSTLATGAALMVAPTASTSYYAELSVSDNLPGSQTFSFTGEPQTFVVPEGVTSLEVIAKAASGGKPGFRSDSFLGKGGKVTTTLSVTPGQTLHLYIGGAGKYPDFGDISGGFNGGGENGRCCGGGGGGATDIRVGGIDLSNRVVVAGGGGGATENGTAGGHGGGLDGAAGGGLNPNEGGGGGSQTAGGVAGTGDMSQGAGFDGFPGGLGVGGAGGIDPVLTYVGYATGGGGGGYYGGGGGGTYGGAGGGGSSYTDAVLCTNVVHTQGDNIGNGALELSWVAYRTCTSATRTEVSVIINAAPTGISVSSISACNGQSTTCVGDDTYTANVTVTYPSKPASGMLSLSGADLRSVPLPTANVSGIGATSHTFNGVVLRADGQAIELTATFSEGSCAFTNSNAGMAPTACSSGGTDTQPPTITCPANIVRSMATGTCSAAVTYPDPIYTDNCNVGLSAMPVPPSLPSGATFPKGTTTVNWQATDGVGLTKTCSFTITVTDGQAPSITCPANMVRNNDAGQCSAVVAYTTPTASDNCSLATGQPQWISGGTTPTASGANSIATFQKGANIVTWRATDGAGLTKTCTFRVTVNDTESPAFTCPAPMSLTTGASACNSVATYTNPAFTDNCTPITGTATRISGLGSGSTFPVGNSNVVFQATDAAGNTRRCTMVITVTDNQPPVINCPASVVATGTGTPCRATVFYGSTTASDNCAGTLTPFLVTGLASGSQFPAGVTTNTFRAVAPNGQSSECSFSVTVDCGSGMGNNGVEVRNTNLSIQHSDKLELKLAPNPALSTVTVSIEGVGAGGGTLLVFDAVGRLVLRQVIAENQQTAVFQVDGSEFTPGMYRVNLRTASGMVTKTLVVVK